MERSKKKKLYAGIILFAFVGSTIAIALLYLPGGTTGPTTTKPDQTLYNRPLTEAEEIPFLQQNIVVVKYFYRNNCIDCIDAETELDKIYNELNGQLLVEKINVDTYPDEATVYNVENIPGFYMHGNEIKVVDWKGQDLIYDICPLYFYQVYACGLIS